MSGSRPRVVAVMTDLLLLSRIDAAAAAAGGSVRRVDAPRELGTNAEADLVLVDWTARESGWGADLGRIASAPDGPRVVLFGRHTDVDAHAAARAAGLGPMWARSKLVAELPALMERTVAP